MSVYVDDVFKWPIPENEQAAYHARRNDGQWCHLIADTRRELLEFGKQIGMKEEWIHQKGQSGEHYDLAISRRTPNKRDRAIKAGAVEISGKALADMCRARRGVLGKKAYLEMEGD